MLPQLAASRKRRRTRRQLLSALRPRHAIDLRAREVFNVVYLDASVAAVLTMSGEIPLVDAARSAGPLARLRTELDNANVASYCAQRQTLFVGHEDGDVVAWDMRMRRVVSRRKTHHAAVKTVELLPDGRVLTAGSDGSVQLHDPLLASEADAPPPQQLAYAPHILWRARVSDDKGSLALVTDLGAVLLLREFDHAARAPFDLRPAHFAPLVAAMIAGQAPPRALPGGFEVLPVPGHCSSVAFSPDGSVLAARCEEQTLVFDLRRAGPVVAVREADGVAVDFIKELSFVPGAVSGAARPMLCSPYHGGVRVFDVRRSCAIVSPRLALMAAGSILTSAVAPHAPEMLAGGTSGEVQVSWPFS